LAGPNLLQTGSLLGSGEIGEAVNKLTDGLTDIGFPPSLNLSLASCFNRIHENTFPTGTANSDPATVRKIGVQKG
jgi:hypothetical protein